MSQATAMVGTRLDLTPSQVSFYVNMAILDVAKSAPHGALESVDTLSAITSRATVPLPTDYLAPIACSTVSSFDSFGNRLLREGSIHEIDNASEGTAENRPNRYAVFNRNLFLYPTPASPHSLTFRYRAVPADITALTSAPSLSTELHPAVLFKTAEYLFGITLDGEREAFARNRYLSYIQAVPPTEQLRYLSERTGR